MWHDHGTVVMPKRSGRGDSISIPATGDVPLTSAQVAAIRRELEIALTHLESLAHLCSVQERAGGAEEAIGAVLHILAAAESKAS